MFIASSKGLLQFKNGELTKVFEGHVHQFAIGESDVLYCACRQNLNTLLRLCPLTGFVIQSIVLPLHKIHQVLFFYDSFYNLCLGVLDHRNQLYIYKTKYNGEFNESVHSKEAFDVGENQILQLFHRDSFWYVVHMSDQKTFCSYFDSTFKQVKQDELFNGRIQCVCLKGQNIFFSVNNTLHKFNLVYKICTTVLQCESNISAFSFSYHPSQLIVSLFECNNHKVCFFDESTLLFKDEIRICDTDIFDVWDLNDFRTVAIGGSTFVQCIASSKIQRVLSPTNDEHLACVQPNFNQEMKMCDVNFDVMFALTPYSYEDDFEKMRKEYMNNETSMVMVGRLRTCIGGDPILWSHCRDFHSALKKRRTVYQTNILVEGEDSYFLYVHPKTREVVSIPNIPFTTKVFSIPVSSLFWHTNICSNDSLVCYRNTYEPLLGEKLIK